jgi:hypothetical protein
MDEIIMLINHHNSWKILSVSTQNLSILALSKTSATETHGIEGMEFSILWKLSTKISDSYWATKR